MGATRKTPESAAEKAETEVPTRRLTKAELVSGLIKKIQAKLGSDEFKPTVGDLLRLLQLEQEMEEEQPREIKVSWIDGNEKNMHPRNSIPSASRSSPISRLDGAVQGILGADRVGKKPGAVRGSHQA